MQKEKPKATTEEVPIAYAVSGAKGGGVATSVVSTHPPSVAFKPKKKYTKGTGILYLHM